MPAGTDPKKVLQSLKDAKVDNSGNWPSIDAYYRSEAIAAIEVLLEKVDKLEKALDECDKEELKW
jgi:hypothetical protein